MSTALDSTDDSSREVITDHLSAKRNNCYFNLHTQIAAILDVPFMTLGFRYERECGTFPLNKKPI